MAPISMGSPVNRQARLHTLEVVEREAVDGFGTRAIHVGSDPDGSTGAIIPAIYLSSTFKLEGIGKHKGYEYSRLGNPNRNALEKLLASLESGGAYALAFASGSATTATVIQSLGHDAHILCVNDVYGGTFRYMTSVAGEYQGVQTTFVDLENADEDQVHAALRGNTKLIWIESPTNPSLHLIDIPRIVAIAKAHPSHPLVLVDNTFMSPFYSSPLLQGADIVLHSLTKYINGHSDVIMGAVILPEHHTVLRDRLTFLQQAIGAVPSPYDSWLAQRGAKTLHLRMKEHGRNALLVARALEKSPYVKEVIYPGLASHPRHELARRSLSPHAARFVEAESEHNADGSFPYGGMVSFRICGGLEEAQRFFNAIRLFTLAVSLGGVESLAELPALMTHGSIPPTERSILGIGDDLIRLSVGVEEGCDLVRDIEQAVRFAVEGYV
ncbi:Cys/Met metabolism PLP-dependent enzyme-domain-containing protein [Russula compacta]|nr:Cys/Met metabolism PLP-dependent enzyme-domain-containing protein [Russula compacta]